MDTIPNELDTKWAVAYSESRVAERQNKIAKAINKVDEYLQIAIRICSDGIVDPRTKKSLAIFGVQFSPKFV